MTTDAIDHAPGEHHLVHRTGWLRAAVLGANDGIISVSSLIVGVAAAPGSTASTVLVAGVAALVGGALAMAAANMFRSVRRRIPRKLTLRGNRPSWNVRP